MEIDSLQQFHNIVVLRVAVVCDDKKRREDLLEGDFSILFGYQSRERQVDQSRLEGAVDVGDGVRLAAGLASAHKFRARKTHNLIDVLAELGIVPS